MSLPNDLRVPSLTNKDLLTGPATIEDVLHILKSMPKGKNPGPNDFSVEFYLFYWEIVGEHHFEGMPYFF